MIPTISAAIVCTAALAGQVESGEYVAMPVLKGKELQQARQLAKLRGVDAYVGVFYISPTNWRSDIKPGVVYMQAQQPGEAVPVGGKTGVWLFRQAAENQPIHEAPNLIGSKGSEATGQIRTFGLVPMGAIPPDEKVIDQYPRPGQPIYRGTGIFLVTKPADGDVQPAPFLEPLGG